MVCVASVVSATELKLVKLQRMLWQALYINYGPKELLEWPMDQRQKHPWQEQNKGD